MPKWKGSPFHPVPDGEYEIEIIGATERCSRNGNEMIEFSVRTGQGAKPFYEYLVFTEACAWKMASFLAAFGEEELADGLEIEGQNYVGRKARAVVVGEVDDPGHKNKITKWLPRQKIQGGKP